MSNSNLRSTRSFLTLRPTQQSCGTLHFWPQAVSFLALPVGSALLSLMLAHAAPAAAQTTYYVDPQGNDRYDGRSPGGAWQSIRQVNRVRFDPGDRVLFKRGEAWREELRPS